MGVSPDSVNWAHVGDIGYVFSRLGEIRDFLGLED